MKKDYVEERVIRNSKNAQDKLKVKFRAMEDGDEEGIIACVRDEYGDTYFKRDFYIAEKIRAMKDHIFFMVCEYKDEIIAVMIIKKFSHYENMLEYASEIIKHRYRGYGITDCFIEYSLNVSKYEACNALYVLPVTFHNITQKKFYNRGFVGTGFFLSVFNMEKIKHSYQNNRCLKHSQTIHIYPRSKTKTGLLYVPCEIKEYVYKIYNRLNVDFELEVLNSDKLKSNEETKLRFKQDSMQSSLEVFVLNIGEDLKAKIESLMHEYDDELQTYNVLISMGDKNVVYAYNILKEVGYFFTGIKPLCSDDEYIIMNNSNNISNLYLEDYSLSDEFIELKDDILEYYKNRKI